MKPKLPTPIKKFEKYAVEFGEAIYSGRVLKILGCELFWAHSTEHRTSNNPEFADYPNYSVCKDCGFAERDVRAGDDDRYLFGETVIRMSREELQKREKEGYKVDEIKTIAEAGIKRNFLSKYDPKLVKEHTVSLRKKIMREMEPDIQTFVSGVVLALSGESLLANSIPLSQTIENCCGELGSGVRVGLGIPLLLSGVGLCFYPIYKNYISPKKIS